jgi:hypothetical protein
MTERGKQDVFPAAAKEGFTAFRNVTRSPAKFVVSTTFGETQCLHGGPENKCAPRTSLEALFSWCASTEPRSGVALTPSSS